MSDWRQDPGIDVDAVTERASVEHYKPPIHGIDEPLWIAEDPDTGCQGLGRVQPEAVGNLVAAVADHEPGATPTMKLPGDSVERYDWGPDDEGLLGGLRDLF